MGSMIVRAKANVRGQEVLVKVRTIAKAKGGSVCLKPIVMLRVENSSPRRTDQPTKVTHTAPMVGVGLRPTHYPHLEQRPSTEVTWFEAISENYMDSQGRPLDMLTLIREDYPVALHGVSLSIASSQGFAFRLFGKASKPQMPDRAVYYFRPPLVGRDFMKAIYMICSLFLLRKRH